MKGLSNLNKCKIVAFNMCILFVCCLFSGCNKANMPAENVTLTPVIDLIGTNFETNSGYIADTSITPFDTPTYTTPTLTLPDNYTMAGEEDELLFDTTSALTTLAVNTNTMKDGSASEKPVTTTAVHTTTGTTAQYVSNPITVPTFEERISVKSVGKQFWYKQLSEKEQNAYNALVKAVVSYDAVVNFETSLTKAEYEKIFGIVFYQNPELFWLCDEFDLAPNGKSANLYYIYTKTQANDIQKFLDSKVATLIKTIPASATDLKKLQLCHDYVCTHTTFSMDYATACTVVGCLVDGVGQCAGYAKTMNYLCNIIDVPCMFVVGKNSEGASHAWNYVQLNNEWYLLDATWDDPILKVPDTQNVCYQYFCVRDIDTRDITHFAVNQAITESKCIYFDVPICTSQDQNIDVVYGNYASTYEEGYEILRADMCKSIESGRTTAHVKFSTQEVYLDARKRLYDDRELLNLKQELDDKYGVGIIKSLSVSKTNSLNYLQVTIVYN